MARRGSTIEVGGIRVRVDGDPRSMPSKFERVQGGQFIQLPKVEPVHVHTGNSTLRPAGYKLRLVDIKWRKSRLYTMHTHLYRPKTESADLVSADEYEAACKKLDKTKAGKRARDLLFSHLTPDQLHDVERYNWFDITLTHPESVDEIEKGRGLALPAAKFRIHRGKVIMNVDFWIFDKESRRRMDPDYNCCIQMREPHPTDDIHFAQLVMLEADPDEFVRVMEKQYANPLLARLIRASRWNGLYHRSRDDRPIPVELPPLVDLSRGRPWQRPNRREEVLAYIDHVLDYRG